MAEIPRRTVLIGVAVLAGIAVTAAVGFIVTKNSASDSDPSPTPDPSQTSETNSSAPPADPRDIGESCGLQQRAELPLPEGVDGPTGEMAISDSGEYIAASTTDGHLIRWRDTEPEVVDRDVGNVADINDSGDIVGTVTEEDRSIWVYRDEDMTPLWPKTADTADVRDDRGARTIHNDGTVLAAVWMDDAESSQILTWGPGQEKPTRMQFDGDEPKYVTDFDSNGNAVGGADPSITSEPMMWQLSDGTSHSLPPPTTSSQLDPRSQLMRVDNEWAVSEEGTLWDLAAPAAEPFDAPEDFRADDVDSQGVIYGVTESSGIQYHDANGIGELPIPPDEASPSLKGVDSTGTAAVGSGDENAYIWTCY